MEGVEVRKVPGVYPIFRKSSKDENLHAFADLFAEGFDVEGMSMTAKASLHAAAWSQLLSTRVPSMSERTASTIGTTFGSASGGLDADSVDYWEWVRS